MVPSDAPEFVVPLALSLAASLAWIAILAVSDRGGARRPWPPAEGSWWTATWAWGLTILIYVGLIRTAAADWNALGLPAWLRWGLGGAGLTLASTWVQGRGIADLGLAGTSGWDVGLVTTGAYARRRHPQYAGQILSLWGLAILGGSLPAALAALGGTVALVYAALVEERFLSGRHRGHAAWTPSYEVPVVTARPDAHERVEARTLSRPEFVAMIAALFATVAFSIDSMLPALPRIAAELTADAPNRAQLVLTAFVLGMGLGTMLAGPISDAIGRKKAITAGLVLYIVAAVAAAQAQTLDLMLLARIVQGVGAAAPRIVAMAMVRDLFEGRRMAQIMSFVMMIFVMIPAVAPFLGTLIIPFFGWRGLFGAYVIFAIIGGLWVNLRQPETLPRTARRPLRIAPLRLALVEVLRHPMVRIYTLVLTLGFGQMFALLSSIQQIYSVYLDRAATFPLWFMATAVLSAAGTMVNAGLVMRVGMRRLAIWSYAAQTGISAVLLVLTVTGAMPAAAAFPVFFAWSVSIFFMAGLTFGNLNALALQPMGHIAGMASSVVGAMSTVLAVMIAAPIGLAFDGTPTPLIAGTLVCSGLAFLLMRRAHDDAEPA